jgi:hypothetical protein
MTFEMLAGKPPFVGDTLAAVVHAIVYTPTPSLAALAKDTPAPIVAAIERAMDKNRDARFPDVNSFVKAVTSRSLATPHGTKQLPPRTQSAIPTERVAREPSRAPVYITFAVGVVVALGFTIWKVTPRQREEVVVAPQAAPVEKPSTSTGTSTPSPEPPSNTNTNTDTPTPTAKVEEPKAAPARRADPATKAKEVALSPEAARDLDEAEAALEAGKPTEALRLAQHSLYAQKSSRAYAVIARARCVQGDLGNAKAALAQVAARDRSGVVRACGKLGVELH